MKKSNKILIAVIAVILSATAITRIYLNSVKFLDELFKVEE